LREERGNWQGGSPKWVLANHAKKLGLGPSFGPVLVVLTFSYFFSFPIGPSFTLYISHGFTMRDVPNGAEVTSSPKTKKYSCGGPKIWTFAELFF
jgi:hypothetical protein